MILNIKNPEIIESHAKVQGIKEPRFIGYFTLAVNERARNFVNFELFELDEYEADWLAPLPVDPGWHIYRVRTNKTRISGIYPLIKINGTLGYVKFMDCNRSDEQVHFGRAYKIAQLTIQENQPF